MKTVISSSNQYELQKNSAKGIKNEPKQFKTAKQYERQKNQYFTGINQSRNHTEIQRSHAKLKYQTPSGSQTDVSRKNYSISQQITTPKQQSKITISISNEAQLQKQIQRLTEELKLKNIEIKNISKINQKRKAQIIELQKKLKHSQGINQAMEVQLKVYEEGMRKIGRQCDERSKYKSQVEEMVGIYQEIRNNNQNLNGKLQQKSYQLNKLTQKYIKLKSKLTIGNINKNTNANNNDSRSASKDSTKLRRGSSLLSISKRFYQGASQSQKQRINYKQISDKLQIMEKSITEFMQQNKKLNSELQQKQQIIHKLRIQIAEITFQNQQQYQKQTPKNVSKNKKKQGQIKLKAAQQKQQNSKEYKQKNNINIILRKLKYNLITEQTTYEDLINILANSQTMPQQLTKYPFYLTLSQSQQLLKWIKNILKQQQYSQQQHFLQKQHKLSQKIPKFKNIILRKIYKIKINVHNSYANRQKQLDQQILRNKIVRYKELQEYFKNWGLNMQQIDLLMKYHYQRTGELQDIDLNVIRDIMRKFDQ